MFDELLHTSRKHSGESRSCCFFWTDWLIRGGRGRRIKTRLAVKDMKAVLLRLQCPLILQNLQYLNHTNFRLTFMTLSDIKQSLSFWVKSAIFYFKILLSCAAALTAEQDVSQLKNLNQNRISTLLYRSKSVDLRILRLWKCKAFGQAVFLESEQNLSLPNVYEALADWRRGYQFLPDKL